MSLVKLLLPCHSDIEMVQKVLEQYKNVMGVRITRKKSSGLWLNDWKGVVLPGSFSWTDGIECGLS